MSKETLSAEAEAALDARTGADRRVILDWSKLSTWIIYGFGALGLILVSFLIFGFIFIRIIPNLF